MQQPVHRLKHIYILPEEQGISVLVCGNTYTNGWTEVQLVPKFQERGLKKGIYEFELVATAPKDQPLPVTTEVIASYTLSTDLPPKKIRVYSESNCMDAVVHVPAAHTKEIPALYTLFKSIAHSFTSGNLAGTVKRHENFNPFNL
ncbi:MAG: hypothetical protein ACJ76F_11610 [Bacteroidia bacterium]